jgi:hypothetical protein
MSNYLPSGCSDREIEYEYSAPHSRDEVAKCDGCEECNLASEMYAVDHYTMCRNCVPICDLCGEFMDNTMFPEKVITIRFARWEMDGKLSAPHCPKCAADWIVGCFIGEQGMFDSDEWGKRTLAARLRSAFPLPVKEAHDAA